VGFVTDCGIEVPTACGTLKAGVLCAYVGIARLYPPEPGETTVGDATWVGDAVEDNTFACLIDEVVGLIVLLICPDVV
jgi:hypothetical protein